MRSSDGGSTGITLAPLCAAAQAPEPAGSWVGLRPADNMNLRWSECAHLGDKIRSYFQRCTDGSLCLNTQNTNNNKLVNTVVVYYSLSVCVCVCVCLHSD